MSDDARDAVRPNPGDGKSGHEAGAKFEEKVVHLALEQGEKMGWRRRFFVRPAGAALRLGRGHRGGLWAAGMLLSRHIAARSSSCYGGGGALSMRGKRVLELGSGTGLAGLAVAACCAPEEVVITDLESHCDLLRFNCDRWTAQQQKEQQGAGGSEQSEQGPLPRVRVEAYDWADEPPSPSSSSSSSSSSFDFIVGSDLAYNPSLYAPLIRALAANSSAHTVTLLGVTRSDTGAGFWSALGAAGFEFYRVPDWELAREKPTMFQQRPSSPRQQATTAGNDGRSDGNNAGEGAVALAAIYGLFVIPQAPRTSSSPGVPGPGSSLTVRGRVGIWRSVGRRHDRRGPSRHRRRQRRGPSTEHAFAAHARALPPPAPQGSNNNQTAGSFPEAAASATATGSLLLSPGAAADGVQRLVDRGGAAVRARQGARQGGLREGRRGVRAPRPARRGGGGGGGFAPQFSSSGEAAEVEAPVRPPRKGTSNNSSNGRGRRVASVLRGVRRARDAPDVPRASHPPKPWRGQPDCTLLDVLTGGGSSGGGGGGFQDLYLVFEFFEMDLEKLIHSRQWITAPHVRSFSYQLLCGLHYMQSANVIHRDLKPQNILISMDCALKICDFGLARVVSADKIVKPEDTRYASFAPTEAADSPAAAAASTATTAAAAAAAAPVASFGNMEEAAAAAAAGMAGTNGPSPPKKFKLQRQLSAHVVTRWYRCPELILLQDYTSAVDMWSAGCILAELLDMLTELRWSRTSAAPSFPARAARR